MKIKSAGALLSSALLSAAAMAADIHVPADRPTIQNGIDAAVDGDRVLVAEGEYLESIDFKGKSIQVLSTGHPHETIIRGAGSSVVLFAAGESKATVLSGFRIEGGQNADVGGGILVGGRAAPEIRRNIIQDNHANGGGGIAVVVAASPWIHDNVIEHNDGGGISRGIGGGILVSSSGFVVIENNRIHANTAATGGVSR